MDPKIAIGLVFENLVKTLRVELEKPLPGKKAHDRMSSRVQRPGAFNFDWDESPRPGAVLILLYPDQGKVFFPLMQRPQYRGVHSGQISLPGGKQEEQDRDLFHTALRETEEEIGVPQKEITVLGSLTPLFIYASNFEILPVVGTVDSKPTFVPDHREVEQVLPTDLNELERQVEVKTTTLCLRDFEIRAPYYDLNQQVVWGATAMILSEFLQVISSLPND